jgi:hypothetical protein
MSEPQDESLLPRDPKRDPVMLKILRWLAEDPTRTLPPPEDDAGIQALAQAIGKSVEYTRALMAWSDGDESDGDTLQILT